METYVQVATIIALLSVSALCVYFIVILVRVKTVLEVVHTEIAEISLRLKPLLENLNIAAEKLRAVTTKIDDQVSMMHSIFISFRRVVNNVMEFEERVLHILEEPFVQIGSLVSGILNRLVSFFGKR